MTVGWILGMLVVVAILIGGAGLGWWVVLRPLDAWVWGTRRALVKAGLKKVIVESPAGPQTVFVGGSGPLLVLLHGAGDQAGTWVHVAPSLAKNHSLLIPDLAGHGDSAPATGPIHTADVFAGLEAVLSSQAPGRRMTLVGTSRLIGVEELVAERFSKRWRRAMTLRATSCAFCRTSTCSMAW